MPSLDTMMSYHRLKRTPLDDSTVFSSLRELLDYCKTGACYNGQKVTVYANDKVVEYSIKKYGSEYIPLINMEGSEPSFKSITFFGDADPSRGLLIYYYASSGNWGNNKSFYFNADKVCLLDQSFIFEIDGEYKICVERINRETKLTTAYYHTFNANDNITINDIIRHIQNNAECVLMPNNENDVTEEKKYITKVYIKAETYYVALYKSDIS